MGAFGLKSSCNTVLKWFWIQRKSTINQILRRTVGKSGQDKNRPITSVNNN